MHCIHPLQRTGTFANIFKMYTLSIHYHETHTHDSKAKYIDGLGILVALGPEHMLHVPTNYWT